MRCHSLEGVRSNVDRINSSILLTPVICAYFFLFTISCMQQIKGIYLKLQRTFICIETLRRVLPAERGEYCKKISSGEIWRDSLHWRR